MVKLTNTTIYVELAPLYRELARLMELAGAETPVFYLSAGEYDNLIRQVVWLGLLRQTNEITKCASQLALHRSMQSFELIGYNPTITQDFRRMLIRDRGIWHAVEESIPLPLNPLSLIAPKSGTIWAIITGA